MAGSQDALALWDALLPKLRQLIREETQSAVRKKKMNIAALDNVNQTVTVYEASNPLVTITLPYTAGIGIEEMTAGQSVMVEWTGNDFSTAVVSMPGRNWTTIDTGGGLPEVGAADNGKLLIVKNGVWTVSDVFQYDSATNTLDIVDQ